MRNGHLQRSEKFSPTEIKNSLSLQNLLLLNQLKQYSRVSTLSQCELEFYQHHIACSIDSGNSLIVSDIKIPTESKQCLPFHALLEETTAESIISEDTVLNVKPKLEFVSANNSNLVVNE